MVTCCFVSPPEIIRIPECNTLRYAKSIQLLGGKPKVFTLQTRTFFNSASLNCMDIVLLFTTWKGPSFFVSSHKGQEDKEGSRINWRQCNTSDTVGPSMASQRQGPGDQK